MSEALSDDEAEILESMMIEVMTKAIPKLQNAIGTGLDPTSVLVGSFLSMYMLTGRSSDELVEFLSDEKNREILLAVREKVS